MWMWTLALMDSSSAAGGEQPDQRGRGVPPDGVIDVPLFLAALDEPGAPERGQVMRQRGRRDLHRLLDLTHRDLPAGADQEEEHLQTREMGEGLEGLDVGLAGVELAQRRAAARCFMVRELSNYGTAVKRPLVTFL